jgi:hypothetical protein
MRIVGESRPLRNFGLGLRRKLRAGIGRHNNLAIAAGAHRPIDEHADECRFADTLPGCDRYFKRLEPITRAQMVPNGPKNIRLPCARAI